MENSDPWLTQDWPWNIHIEYVRKEVSEKTYNLIKDIMEGKPYKMKAEDITNDEVKRVARYILETQLEDVEYLTVTEISDDQIDGVSDLENEEQEKVWRRVDAMISTAEVTITFPDEV